MRQKNKNDKGNKTAIFQPTNVSIDDKDKFEEEIVCKQILL